jgi:hypothetical protein
MNIKLKLFNFKNELTMDQLDEAKIAQLHLENYENLSEKELFESLRNHLNGFTYDHKVVSFLESVKGELDSKPLIYELKDLYKKVERKNMGLIYRQPLVTLLEIINRPDDESRMEGVLNELSIYDWVPEIKSFLLHQSKNPMDHQNLQRNGNATKIYTLVERCNEGSLVFVSDRWFLVNENEIKQVVVDDYIQDIEKMKEIRILEQVLNTAEIYDNKIEFKIDEQLYIGISTKDKNIIFMNGEKLDKETTLESIFNSPIVPYLQRNQYVLLESARNNLDKFMDLDIAVRVDNPLNPYLEAYCFNYKDKMYLYSRDMRTGSAFFQYENASEIIRDVQKELDYDLTKFFENKLSKELKHLRALEDKEKVIDMKLKEINESVDLLKESDVWNEPEIQLTYKNLMTQKNNLINNLNLIKADKIRTRKLVVNG